VNISSEETPAHGRLPGARLLAMFSFSVIGLLLLFPLEQTVRFGLTTKAIREVVGNTRMRQVLWFTTWQAIVSTLLVLFLAIPAAFVFGRFHFAGRQGLLAFLAAPFTLPTTVVGAAFLATLPAGHQKGVWPIIGAHTFFNVGIAIRIISRAVERSNSRLEEVAATLGASPRRIRYSVSLPLLRHALAAAASLVFALSFMSFGVVVLLGGPTRATIDVEVSRQVLNLQPPRVDRAAVLAMIQVLTVAIVLILTNAYAGSRPTTANREFTRTLVNLRGGRSRAASVGALIAPTLLVTLPIAALVRRSMQQANGQIGLANLRHLWQRTVGNGLLERPIDSLTMSVQTAIIASIIAIGIGIISALVIVSNSTRAAPLLKSIATLPLTVSAVMLGLGYLLAFARSPVAWRSRWFIVPLVQAIVALPFVVRILLPAWQRIPPHTKEAAATLGASPWRVLATVDFPMIRSALQTCLGYAFAISLGEFGAATFLARPQRLTMPLAIARLSGRPGSELQGQAAALALILGAITFAVTLLANRASGHDPSAA
jgi:thiamine transport system permease protein